MHCFKDQKGNAWPVVINLYAIEKVKAEHKVDLLGLFDRQAEPLGEFMTDDFAMCAVLYDLGQPDNEKAGRTPDDLKRAWGGETADAAADAFLEELIDFFRDPERRSRLRRLVAKFKEVGAAVLENRAKAVDEIDPAEVIRLLSAGPAAGPSPSAGSTPAPSASTPGLSRSAS